MAKAIKPGATFFAIGHQRNSMLPTIRKVKIVRKGEMLSRTMGVEPHQHWYVRGYYDDTVSDLAEKDLIHTEAEAKQILRKKCTDRISEYTKIINEET